MPRHRPSIRREPEHVRDRFGLLLLLLTLAFLALGFSTSWMRVLAGALELAAFVVAFAATGLRLNHILLSGLAAAGVVATVLAGVSGPPGVAQGLGSLAACTVLVAMLVGVLDRVLRHREVTIQTLFGAVCAYFLLGLLYSAIYSALDAFGSTPIFGAAEPSSVYSYFSFVTLTTVGYGDFTAVTDLGRRVAAIEAVTGQVFLATTLARLVSLFRAPGGAAPEV
jgi:hypothetical protein